MWFWTCFSLRLTAFVTAYLMDIVIIRYIEVIFNIFSPTFWWNFYAIFIIKNPIPKLHILNWKWKHWYLDFIIHYKFMTSLFYLQSCQLWFWNRKTKHKQFIKSSLYLWQNIYFFFSPACISAESKGILKWTRNHLKQIFFFQNLRC